MCFSPSVIGSIAWPNRFHVFEKKGFRFISHLQKSTLAPILGEKRIFIASGRIWYKI